MTTLVDHAHISVRGHDVIAPPERPAQDWKAAVKVVWQRAKLDAHANGSDDYDGVPGAVYTGSIGGIVPFLWPELDPDAMKHAKNRIAQDIYSHGAAKCLDRGNYQRNQPPSWFIADQYGALPVQRRPSHHKKKATTIVAQAQAEQRDTPATEAPVPAPRPAPEPAEVQVDEVTAKKLAKLTTKADKMRMAIRALGEDATAPEIVRWLQAYGYTVSNPHAHQVLDLWHKSGGGEYPSSKAVQAAVEADAAEAAAVEEPAVEAEAGDRSLGTSGAAAYLGISESTLIRRSDEGVLPCIWAGTNRRFRKWRVADLDDYRASGKSGARGLYGRLLSITEAAEYLGLSKSTVERYTTAGELSAVRIGPTKRVRRWRRVDLDAYKAKAGHDVETVAAEAVEPVQPTESAVAVTGPAQETAVAVADTTAVERSVPQYEITSMRERMTALEQENADLKARLAMAKRMVDQLFVV